MNEATRRLGCIRDEIKRVRLRRFEATRRMLDWRDRWRFDTTNAAANQAMEHAQEQCRLLWAELEALYIAEAYLSNGKPQRVVSRATQTTNNGVRRAV